MTISEEKLTALRAEHRRVKVIAVGDIEFVIRAPKRHEYKAFRNKAMGEQKADALEDLLRTIVVFPSRQELDAILDDYPGLAESKDFQKSVEQFVGMVADDSGKGSAPSSSGSGFGPNPSPTA